MDEAALAEALDSGGLAAACLDVLHDEPPDAANVLVATENCYLTPHNAWATLSARQRLIDIVAENVAAFLRGAPTNVVNGGEPPA